MEDSLESYLGNLEGFVKEDINIFIIQIEGKYKFQFPGDYLKLLVNFNGAEGEIGENGWLTLFKASELLLFNESNNLLLMQVPEYFIFGKDAADTAFAFHKYLHSYHSFGFLSDFEVDEIQFCGDSLLQFLRYISSGL